MQSLTSHPAIGCLSSRARWLCSSQVSLTSLSEAKKNLGHFTNSLATCVSRRQGSTTTRFFFAVSAAGYGGIPGDTAGFRGIPGDTGRCGEMPEDAGRYRLPGDRGRYHKTQKNRLPDQGFGSGCGVVAVQRDSRGSGVRAESAVRDYTLTTPVRLSAISLGARPRLLGPGPVDSTLDPSP